MIPSARENWRSLLSEESKIIANRQVLFAGDDFENIVFFEKCSKTVDFANGFIKKNVHFVSIKKRQDYILSDVLWITY